MNHNNEQLEKEWLEITANYFSGALGDANDESLPDGAWYQILVDTAQYLLRVATSDPDSLVTLPEPPSELSGIDIVNYWIENRGG